MKNTKVTVCCMFALATLATPGCDKGSESPSNKDGTSTSAASTNPKDGAKSANDGPLAQSTWVGSAQGWTLTMKITRDVSGLGVRMLKGTMTTNRDDCVRPGELNLKMENTTLSGFVTTNGGLAESSTLTLKLDVTDQTMSGTFSVMAFAKDMAKTESVKQVCDISDQQIQLQRQ